MNLRRALVIGSCLGLTAMSLPAGRSCDTQVRFVKLARNVAAVEPAPRYTAGGSIWIVKR